MVHLRKDLFQGIYSAPSQHVDILWPVNRMEYTHNQRQ